MRCLPLLLLLAAPALADDKAVEALAGTYTVKEFAREGKAAPDDVKKGMGAVTVADGKITFTQNGKERVARLRADAARKPAEIELIPEGDEFDKGRAFKGIYELKGDTLTITFVEDGERPTDFATTAKTATKLVLVKK
jgi:uncharacterized protein (TIGR03067 family)